MTIISGWFCRLGLGAVLVASAFGKSLNLPGFMELLPDIHSVPWLVTLANWTHQDDLSGGRKGLAVVRLSGSRPGLSSRWPPCWV